MYGFVVVNLCFPFWHWKCWWNKPASVQWMLLLGHCCLPTIGKIARQNTAVNIHWIQECPLAEKCKRHPQKTSVQHGCILLSKFNDFLSPSEKIEKFKFEPLLEVWGHSYIVRNTMRKVGLPVKIRGQPSPYDDPFWRYVFLLFLPKFPL